MTDTPEIIEYKNGLRVVLEKRDYTDICSVNIKVASGSSMETPECSGISHFIEHMLFKGTANRTACEIAEETDEIGGITNAYTTKEDTCLYVSSLSEHAPKALDILCDMVVNPLMSEEDAKTEKGVIIEEIEMYDDSPEDVCAEGYDEAVFHHSSLSLRILGTPESVKSITSEDLKQRHKKYFVPERTVISICGKFDKSEILTVIDRYYKYKVCTYFYPQYTEAEFISSVKTISRDFRQNQLILGFPGINNYDERKYAALLLSTVLGGSTSSLLFQRLREKLGLVYSVDSFNTSVFKSASFSICAGYSHQDEVKVITEIINIVKAFGSSITEKDIKRAKEQAISGLVMGLEASSARASRNGRHIMLYGKITSEKEAINAYRNVTLDEIIGLSEEIFDFNKASLCVTGKVKKLKFYKKMIGGP